MKGLTEPHFQGRVFDACGIAGFINTDGTRENGERIKHMIMTMTERENGLGAGYAVYGLFPNYADYYCLQVILDDKKAKERLEEYLKTVVDIEKDEEIYTQHIRTLKPPYPLVWRFFVEPTKGRVPVDDPDEYMVDIVMHINEEIDGAFCMSSGKNMGVFKGNGWSHEIADFYDIERYKGFMWVGHSRFPTNAPGWWGGAHPFNILGWSVAHNGEITSYGTNKRYVEMWGYRCTLLTDTEVMAYLWDLLVKKQKLPIMMAAIAIAPPYYYETEETFQRMVIKALRATYRSAMVNGPFSVVVGTDMPVHTLIGLTDRKKLRPLTAGISEDGKTVFISSEECAIRRVEEGSEMQPWAPEAGNPIIAQMGSGLVWKGTENPFRNMNAQTALTKIRELKSET